MTRDDDLEQLHRHLETLCRPRVTVEHIPGWTPSRNRTFGTHRVEHHALLLELALAVHRGDSRAEDAGGNSVPGPRDGARLGPIDLLARIRADVVVWTDRLGIIRRERLADNLSAIAGVAGNIHADLLHNLLCDARSWVIRAEVLVGWRTPPFAPHGVPCPLCELAGGLRIHYQQEKACCLHCNADWHKTDGSLYILGEHVKLHTEASA